MYRRNILMHVAAKFAFALLILATGVLATYCVLEKNLREEYARIFLLDTVRLLSAEQHDQFREKFSPDVRQNINTEDFEDLFKSISSLGKVLDVSSVRFSHSSVSYDVNYPNSAVDVFLTSSKHELGKLTYKFGVERPGENIFLDRFSIRVEPHEENFGNVRLCEFGAWSRNGSAFVLDELESPPSSGWLAPKCSNLDSDSWPSFLSWRYGPGISWFDYAMSLVFFVLLALLPPVVTRFLILKRQMSVMGTWVFLVIMYFVNFSVQYGAGLLRQNYVGGPESRPGIFGIFFMLVVTYFILRYQKRGKN